MSPCMLTHLCVNACRYELLGVRDEVTLMLTAV
jgi:hypothetical protein